MGHISLTFFLFACIGLLKKRQNSSRNLLTEILLPEFQVFTKSYRGTGKKKRVVTYEILPTPGTCQKKKKEFRRYENVRRRL
jgi:hypothetical protein